MSNILLVPIHLDALVLHEDKMVVEAMADFSRLPFFDGTQDVNPDVANISEEIVSPPFENRNLLLKAGLHLHWSLPDALTRSRHTQGGQDFPRVPNRWLVARRDSKGISEWIVESDYLYPEKSENQSEGSVSVPSGQSRPFRYMGRTMPLQEWLQDKSQADHYPKLTAIGYGEPTFAAFYPNCHSIFGFYDPEHSTESVGNEYYIIGWYSKPPQDYLGEFIQSLPPEVNTNEKRIEALKDDFKWTLKLDDSLDFPQQMFCYAKLVFGIEQDPPPDESVTIAVGNTGTEALSAYLAGQLGGDPKEIIEDQLEALQLSPKLEHRQLDIGSKFLEARHEKGFTAIPGGSLWSVRPESTTTAAADVSDAQAEITLPGEIAQLLNAVNDRQAEYDRAWQEIESMRVQLFSDWYKYMLCAYPPEDARDAYPDIDDVKSYVEGNVASLTQKIARAGTLLLNQVNGRVFGLTLPGDKGVVSVGAVVAPQPALADALADDINKLQDFMDVRCGVGGAGPAYRLKQISGPRYWRPTEPVVLIKGSIAEASDRHGQDGQSSEGLMETQSLLNADTQRLLGLDFSQIRDAIDDIGKHPDGNFAFSTWTAQPWNPFLLEWEVEVFPVANASNLNPATRRYQEAFIRKNYSLNENQTDLSIADDAKPTSAACVYSGRSILTPHAGIQLTKQIEAYLIKASWLFAEDAILDAKALCGRLREQQDSLSINWLKKFGQETPDLFDKGKPLPETTDLLTVLVAQLNTLLKDASLSGQQQPGATDASDELRLAELMRANRRLFEETYPQEIAQTPTGIRRAFDNIRKAYDLIIAPEFHCLSQSLGGFNEALLMHKLTMQLGISDPIGFDDYQKPFAENVRDAVSNSIYSAPEPLNDFNPIRSGAMTILQLRLVDTFGQTKDLNLTDAITGEPNVITSEPMTNAADAFHVRLAPRLVQPARINFRWLAAESDEQEMNDHPATTPICGWVLTNNLDNSLMLYDNKGKALGSLVMKDADPTKPTWEPAPGGGADAVNKIDDIKNLHLMKMVFNIREYGADFLSDFIIAVDNALENIEPENFAQHQDIALLMGRPLALVRASLNLELKGLPSVHQGWNDFRQDMQRDARNDNGFSAVEFPIRIGEYKQFNDGTVGYWKEAAGDGYEGDVFYAPQSDEEVKETDSHLKTHHPSDPVTIFQSVNSKPQILSLLLDPRGLVHATSGILPAKAIRIPPDQYADALQAIEITFLSTPILTDVGKIHLPLPAEAGYQWSWLQQDGQKAWTEISSRGIVKKDAFAGLESDADGIWDELKKKENGWIEVIDPNDQTRASVTAKDKRKSQSLPDNLKDKTVEIEDILDRAHIGPINPGAKFSGPQEIREGWLRLSVDKGNANLQTQAPDDTVIANPKQ